MDKLTYFKNAYKTLRDNGIVHTQKDLALLLGVSEGQISKAMKGYPGFLTDNLIAKVQAILSGQPIPKLNPNCESPVIAPKADTLPVIPTEAVAGTLGDFADSVAVYECERMISPIKGADYAMRVCGNSMSPEYESGCQILIKKIFEKQFIEWGKTYVLDTSNGAVIKQIFPTDNPSVVECRSINPEYPPFRVKMSDINGWYRVLMAMSLK